MFIPTLTSPFNQFDPSVQSILATRISFLHRCSETSTIHLQLFPLISAGPNPNLVNDIEGLGQVRVRRSPEFSHPLLKILQDKRRQPAPAAFASPYMRSMRRLHTRRTMPFQLIPHQPSAFVGETMPVFRQSGLGSAADFDETEMGESFIRMGGNVRTFCFI